MRKQICERLGKDLGVVLFFIWPVDLRHHVVYYIKMDETEKINEKLLPIFKEHPEIKLVYFFGSKVKGESGPLSDYDFGIYTGEKKPDKIFKLKFSLQDKISRALGTDKVDVVMMDIAQSPELKYGIIKEGKLIYEKEPYRVLVEPKILNEYFDFHAILLRYGLTKA